MKDTLPASRCVRQHIARWKAETRHWSSLARRFAHPSYGRIIALARACPDADGARAVLQALQTDPDHWFLALTAITGANPLQPDHTFDEAVQTWLEWGHMRGLLGEGHT